MIEHLLPLFASQQGSGTHKLLAATQTRAETDLRQESFFHNLAPFEALSGTYKPCSDGRA